MSSQFQEWLDSLGLSKYLEVFDSNDIDFRALNHVTEQDLKDLGMSLGHRRILLAAKLTLVLDGQDDLPVEKDHNPGQVHEAERRQLTVVFCDLVGSTGLSRKLDPEEMRDVLRRFQNAVTAAIQRHDGYVAKFLGDGVLSYFGWPQAYEDQVERAVRAGLNIVERVASEKIGGSEKLQVRIGIDTGQVVVGDLVGDRMSDAEAVIGQTPNLAARLQSIAQVGQVLIGASTRSLLGSTFELESLGPQELKGFPDPVEVWSVVRENEGESRFSATRSSTLTTLVGREHELGLLRERWDLAKQKEGQVVLLSGEAGIGKSRIVQDLLDEIGRESCSLLAFQCSAHHANNAFHPVVQYLRRNAGFVSVDDGNTKLDKLETILAKNGLNPSVAAPVFARLLSLPKVERYDAPELPPQQLRNKIIELLIELVLFESDKKPVLCVIEDVHWCDPSMTEFIGELMPLIASRSAYLLITFRPSFSSPWLDYTHVSAISFNRLGRNQAAEIVRSVAGPELFGAILDQIVARSDGVPLYVEELTKSVLESVSSNNEPIINELIPSTLQSSLVARLDHLEGAKETAQVGAVIGREFPHELVISIMDKADSIVTADLERLVQSGLVIRRGSPPDATYTFKHSLVQDAAYATILKSKRRQLHAKIVDALEARVAGHVIERIDALAHHSYHGQIWDKAFNYRHQAGRRAMDRSALREAAAQFEHALEVSTNLPETNNILRQVVDLRLELRNALWALGRFETILTHLADAERITNELDDPIRLGWISVYESASLWQLGRSKKALQAAQEALKTSSSTNDLSLAVAAKFYLGCAHVTTGECTEAEKLFRNIADSLTGELRREQCGLPFAPAVIARSWLVWALAERGEFELGSAHGADALHIAQELGHPFNLAHIYYDLGYFYEIRGEIDSAVDALEKSMSLVNQWSLTYLSPFIMGFLGHVYALSGRIEEGAALLQKAVAAYESMGLGLFRSLVLIQYGEALLLGGNADEALSITNQALVLSQKRGELGHQAYGFKLLGDIEAHPDRNHSSTAMEHYEKALKAAENLGMRPLVAHCNRAIANLFKAMGNRNESKKHAEIAVTMSSELKMKFWQDSL